MFKWVLHCQIVVFDVHKDHTSNIPVFNQLHIKAFDSFIFLDKIFEQRGHGPKLVEFKRAGKSSKQVQDLREDCHSKQCQYT